MGKTVLIVEDEKTINRVLSSYFRNKGFNVISTYDGNEGLNAFNSNDIDIICLDIMMPKTNGWDVAAEVRKSTNIPIIMMSALSEDEDILKGYSLHVDDYITKPFNPQILVAKVEALLDRLDNKSKNVINVLNAPGIKLEINNRKVFIDNKEIKLTKTEFDLLAYLLLHEGTIFSRDHLLDEVWGLDVFVEDRIVDTYIKKLRKHLGPYALYIKTIFGVGYRFEVINP
ncbi:MAG: response regulator transcription factor [Bacillota bacterium]